MWAAQRAVLPGGRWHFQHGPIDIVISAEGDAQAVAAAHDAAWACFQPLLAGLVAELPLLRQPVAAAGTHPLQGVVARRMWAACAPLRHAADGFITPMAAVAGAVAQELIAAYQRPGIHRAWVNNGATSRCTWHPASRHGWGWWPTCRVSMPTRWRAPPRGTCAPMRASPWRMPARCGAWPPAAGAAAASHWASPTA
jgi:hypothetical protein